VQFRITRHSGFEPPADALELLSARLGDSRRLADSGEEFFFAMVGPEIRATTVEDAPVSMTRDERAEIGRRAILGFVSEVCEETPELSLDWFAVSSEL
jgi:hypothetical protein